MLYVIPHIGDDVKRVREREFIAPQTEVFTQLPIVGRLISP